MNDGEWTQMNPSKKIERLGVKGEDVLHIREYSDNIIHFIIYVSDGVFNCDLYIKKGTKRMNTWVC